MPYSVLMEIALQPCGFLGAYLGITLQYADRDDLFIRNLDGFGIMTGFQDWRGKTIENKSIMTTYVALGGSLIQKYDFELYCEGKKFYEGFASFGFFTKENLSSQSGLDNGKLKATWLEENPNAAVKRYNFALPIVKKLFFDEKNNKAHYRLSNTQLHLVDELAVVQNGGKYGKGYAYGNKKISPADWYFACHFYQDPVMPGSLGVESIMEVLQGFAIQQKIGENFENPRFELLDNNKTVWKYRGQILQTDELMQLEIHIKEVRYLENKIDIVADASLWKNKLRIYEVSDIGVSVRNA
jgi:3-hydroxymyristoyl/3-hydroxydecanoyl-(acyl carrier protein) dehydratase